MGFPSPAQDYAERRIDLNALMVLHPAATLFIPTTDGMVLVDKSMKPKVGDVVYFEAWGTFQVGRLGKYYIVCQDGETIDGEALENVTIIGTVTFEVLHVHEESRPTI
jgi:DNA polymerase V